ncbi:MFS transporter [Alishewanella jeotgali]|uniref:Putative fosmidomycin resistance protein n=1 Tax=Alishewanella jeotgali KCTC 22429 TaxID=1129374 RepID=H3ZI16_9ALTE|nr:MFS transporter [Alishewanella jeotgali]EHR39658.1 putative fosmidomycin resistance protein [Alishewanella jeotgali KCTC 22429]
MSIEKTTTFSSLTVNTAASISPAASPALLVLPVVGAVSFVHLLNDLIQAILPAIYPMLKQDYALSFTQIGLITLIFQLTASLLQPAVGLYTDKHPKPFLLPLGMLFTLLGLVLLSVVGSFPLLLLASAMIGLGSSTFHPEASRVARMASGGRYGFAQGLFQVGGNAGSALGPLLAAIIIMPRGQGSIGWFCLFAIVGIMVLLRVSRWVVSSNARLQLRAAATMGNGLTTRQTRRALLVLALLVFSKYVYMTCLSNFYTFYLIETFAVSVATSQLYLFLFLAAVAVGTVLGGPIGDKIGRKPVIWVSILGAAPLALLLPYSNLAGVAILTVLIGLIMSSAFSAIIVFAQELMPAKIGMISGVFYGMMFGISGIAAALLGMLADASSISTIFKLCAWFPLLGMLAFWLPRIPRATRH